MSLSERLVAFDGWLLDRCFQPLSDRLASLAGGRDGGSGAGFELGMNLQLGAVVLDLAADVALLAAGLLDWASGLYDALSWVGGVWFYHHLGKQRALVREGRANPLRVLHRSMRLLTLGFTLWSVWGSTTAGHDAALSYALSALSALLFAAGLYFVACQPRPPQRRSPLARTAPGLA